MARSWVSSLMEVWRESSCLRCCCLQSWGWAMLRLLHAQAHLLSPVYRMQMEF